jgi:hypothetical protein
MHASAQAAWQAFITGHEGNVAHMYLDTKGLVTIGIGNLIDPISLALTLPFQFKVNNRAGVAGGKPATVKEIEAEWLSLKNSPNRLLLTRSGASASARVTDLELSPASRQRLFDRVTNAHEAQLTTYFASFPNWPGDAQLGVMAMAWGLGVYFPPKFPKFTAACQVQDFDAAARECNISSWRAERNQASVRFSTNAACVVRNPSMYDPTQTYYPQVLVDTIQVTA